MSRKCCILDAMPAVLLRDCHDVLVPVITRIVNLSLDSSSVPTKYKEKGLTPIIKKDSFDHELNASFRPISNLRFISKATEKLVAIRLDSYLKDNDLQEQNQSAYEAGHGTETALTRVNNGILCAIDDGHCVILVLLDLSAALVVAD